MKLLRYYRKREVFMHKCRLRSGEGHEEHPDDCVVAQVSATGINGTIPSRSETGLPSISKHVDPPRIVAFLSEFAIFVKQCRTYPAEHPLVIAATAKTLRLLSDALAKQEDLAIGVTKNRLYAEKNFVEPYNLRFQLLANLLHDHGIAAVTFTRTTTADDLVRFIRLLEIQPPQLWRMGGPSEFLVTSGVTEVKVQNVTSDFFHLREESTLTGDTLEEGENSLWETLIRCLGRNGLLPGADDEIPDAAGLARFISEAALNGVDVSALLAVAQQEFLDRLPPGLVVYNSKSLEQILAFVRELSPRHRKLFLMNFFGAAPDRGEFVESLAAELPDVAVMDALKAVSSESYIPPMAQRLLAKLAAVSPVTDPAPMQLNDETDEKMRLLLRKENVARYIPEQYRKTLISILGNDLDPTLHEKELAALRQTFETEDLNRKTMDVIFELFNGNPEPGSMEGLVSTLREIVDHFLETAEYGSLGRVYEKIRCLSTHPNATLFAARMQEHLTSPAFTRALLDSLGIGSNDKRQVTTEFIVKIGPSIIPVLLDRLAEEENMSLRRYYMDRLIEFGSAARDAAIERLGDSRWFFVRNLVILLRVMNDQVSLEQIRALSSHQHPRIREEVLKTFRNCGEAIGEEALLRELGSADRERVLKAVRMAETSRSEKVMAKLLEILTTARFSGSDYELKRAAVNTLAEIGNPKALPGLTQLLRSRNLLRPVLHGRLKSDVLRSLERYPESENHYLRTGMAGIGAGEKAKQSAQTFGGAAGRKR
jgi:hypothetical protein